MRADDIVRQRFSKVFRGYDIQEVDLFLDEVIRTLEGLERERNLLLSRVEALLNELDKYDALIMRGGGVAPQAGVDRARPRVSPQAQTIPTAQAAPAAQAAPVAAHAVQQQAEMLVSQAAAPEAGEGPLTPYAAEQEMRRQMQEMAEVPGLKGADVAAESAAPGQMEEAEEAPFDGNMLGGAGHHLEEFLPGHPMGEPPPLRGPEE